MITEESNEDFELLRAWIGRFPSTFAELAGGTAESRPPRFVAGIACGALGGGAVAAGRPDRGVGRWSDQSALVMQSGRDAPSFRRDRPAAPRVNQSAPSSRGGWTLGQLNEVQVLVHDEGDIDIRHHTPMVFDTADSRTGHRSIFHGFRDVKLRFAPLYVRLAMCVDVE